MKHFRKPLLPHEDAASYCGLLLFSVALWWIAYWYVTMRGV